MKLTLKQDHPLRVFVISGSQRHENSCPGRYSKASYFMKRMKERLPKEWEIDTIDLGNQELKPKIQSCNACVSTSMALCVWPCNCYEKNNKSTPDLMWNGDMYTRLDLADAWAIIGPVNWYGPSSNLKLMFDRLVCMNGGNPDEKLIKHKDPDLAMKLEKTDRWKELSKNHLEGRTAGFFLYGDEGGSELDETGRPKILEHKNYFDPSMEPNLKNTDMRNAYAPFVWQCRYGGIEVPDELWKYSLIGAGKTYSETQIPDIKKDTKSLTEFDEWVDRFKDFVEHKGKVMPGTFRAYGYQAPKHVKEDITLVAKTLVRKVKRAIGAVD